MHCLYKLLEELNFKLMKLQLWLNILVRLGPIRNDEKSVYLDKSSVITSGCKVRRTCRVFTSFMRDKKMFKGTADKICP